MKSKFVGEERSGRKGKRHEGEETNNEEQVCGGGTVRKEGKRDTREKHEVLKSKFVVGRLREGRVRRDKS